MNKYQILKLFERMIIAGMGLLSYWLLRPNIPVVE